MQRKHTVKLTNTETKETRTVEVTGPFQTQEDAERHVAQQYANAKGRGAGAARKWQVVPQKPAAAAGGSEQAEAKARK